MATVRITPIANNDLDYQFTIYSEADHYAKSYEFDTKIEAVRERKKAVDLFKQSGYSVLM
jgi:hypothetical protein